MRSKIFIPAILLVLATSAAFSQGWTFARNAGGTGDDSGDRVTLDREGNSYVTGVFSGTANFDGTSLVGPGKSNLYLAKYGPEHQLRWANTIAYTSAPAGILATGIAIDNSGNIYLGGTFTKDITLGGTKRNSLGASDMYLLKVDRDGKFIWGKTPGGNNTAGQDVIAALGIDSLGNCYVTGNYDSSATFDGITITAPRAYEMFIAKYDSSGKALWARSAGGEGAFHFGQGIFVDNMGNSYITGRFSGGLLLGQFSFVVTDGQQKAFIARADPDGNFVWAKQIGTGNYYGSGNDVVVDNDGKVSVCGFFRGTILLGDSTYSSNGGFTSAALFVQYDRNGEYLWSVRSYRDEANTLAERICVDDQGTVFSTGTFHGTVQFGSITMTSPNASSNTFVVAFGPHGDYRLVTQVAGTNGAFGTGIAAGGNGDCLVTGMFSNSATAGSLHLQSFGGMDMFVAGFSLNGASVDNSGDEISPDLHLYPNPAGDRVRLNGAALHGRIEIFSIDGVPFMTADDAENIDISTLPAGTYFVRAGGRFCKLIKSGSFGK
ncbi:MAG: T9SS type A sorting domain-containing protein [Bacteroidota bacterium]